MIGSFAQQAENVSPTHASPHTRRLSVGREEYLEQQKEELEIMYEEKIEELQKANRRLETNLRRTRKELAGLKSKLDNAENQDAEVFDDERRRSRQNSICSSVDSISSQFDEIGEDQKSTILNDILNNTNTQIVEEMQSEIDSYKIQIGDLTESLRNMENEKSQIEHKLLELSQLYQTLTASHEKLIMEREQEILIPNEQIVFPQNPIFGKSLFEELTDNVVKHNANEREEEDEAATEHRKIISILKHLPINTEEVEVVDYENETVVKDIMENGGEEDLKKLICHHLLPYLRSQESKRKSYKSKCKFLVGEVQLLEGKLKQQNNALKSAEEFLHKVTGNFDQVDMGDFTALLDNIASSKVEKDTNTIGVGCESVQVTNVEIQTEHIIEEYDEKVNTTILKDDSAHDLLRILSTAPLSSPRFFTKRSPLKHKSPVKMKLISKKPGVSSKQTIEIKKNNSLGFLKGIIIGILLVIIFRYGMVYLYRDYDSAADSFIFKSSSDLIDMYDVVNVALL